MTATSEQRCMYLNRAMSEGVRKVVTEIRKQKQLSALKEIFIKLTRLNTWDEVLSKYGEEDCTAYLQQFAHVSVRKGFIPKEIVEYCANLDNEDNFPSINICIEVDIAGKPIQDSIELKRIISKHRKDIKRYVLKHCLQNEQ